MGLNETPSGERLHIGVFGRTNAGKSSLINRITNQDLAIVSAQAGTTTDPVKKAMELLPLGPVVFVDTPGLDDTTELGKKRVEKSYEALRTCDIVLLVIPADATDLSLEQRLVAQALEEKRHLVLVLHKADQLDQAARKEKTRWIQDTLGNTLPVVAVSSERMEGLEEVKETIAHVMPQEKDRPLIRDLLSPGDLVVMVVPIDSAAPKGRLILPQQQVIRDTLEAGAISVVARQTELEETLKSLAKQPRIVVTDSQVFGYVANVLPKEIPLTSFSILMARYKGDLKTQVEGAKAIERLKDGDKVLISEGCTHHRQCGDIGTVKMPKWIGDYTGKDLAYEFTSGGTFPEDLSAYAMVVHCGGCTLNLREMRHRIAQGAAQDIPITNYGVMIAYMHGILPRVIAPFLSEKE